MATHIIHLSADEAAKFDGKYDDGNTNSGACKKIESAGPDAYVIDLTDGAFKSKYVTTFDRILSANPAFADKPQNKKYLDLLTALKSGGASAPVQSKPVTAPAAPTPAGDDLISNVSAGSPSVPSPTTNPTEDSAPSNTILQSESFTVLGNLLGQGVEKEIPQYWIDAYNTVNPGGMVSFDPEALTTHFQNETSYTQTVVRTADDQDFEIHVFTDSVSGLVNIGIIEDPSSTRYLIELSNWNGAEITPDLNVVAQTVSPTDVHGLLKTFLPEIDPDAAKLLP